VEFTSVDISHKQFRKRWHGYDHREVDAFLQQIAEQLQDLTMECAKLQGQYADKESELKGYKEREKTIRNVLLSAHKTVEQMKANAEKESRLIISNAELKAEKILQGAHHRMAQLHEDIAELKRQRIQFESKLRATIGTYQQLLNMDSQDEKDSDPGNSDKALDH
jgi:cell division initiation protein